MKSDTSVGSADFGRHLWLVEDAAGERASDVGSSVVIHLDGRVVNGHKLLLTLVNIDRPGKAAAGDRNPGNGLGNALSMGRSDESKGNECEKK